MSNGQSFRARRLRLTRLEERALFDATPLGALPVGSTLPAADAADLNPDPGHGNGCTCGGCVRMVSQNGMEAWALSPIYTGGENGPRDPIPPYATTETFLLHSRPAATKKIYLDFNGHVTSGTQWNTDFHGGSAFTSAGWSLDASPTTYTDAEHERIQKIWQRVMEDFSPFDVDVTTQEPAAGGLTYSGGTDTAWGVRVIITPTDNWVSAGGIAYLNSFRSNVDVTCYAFSDNLGPNNEKSIAEAISHEVGHTLGLSHDGRTTPSEQYYQGHITTGQPGWAPIMGVGYSREVVQWSRGEYANASQTQDDLTIITNTTRNFGYRPDDAGGDTATSAALTIDDTAVSASGVIERTTDVDFWRFASGAGPVTFTFSPWVNSPNLDILAELRDSAGTLLASSNPASLLSASIAFTLPAQGTYYLTVNGVGVGTASNGYTEYGSLGQYTIAGTIVAANRLTGLETAAISFTENQAPVVLTSALVVTAGTNLNQATVAISNYANGQDVLQFTNQAGITGNFDTATGILTLTGTATPAVYQTALRSITYANASDNPSTTTRTLTFRVRDTSNNVSAPANRNLTITAVNDAPTADNDTFATNEDTVLTVPAATGVLDGDTDVDNATLTAVLVDNVQHGTLTLNANGSFTYTPVANYNGPDSFTYRARDGSLNSNLATVALTVTAVNDAPVADNDTYVVDEDDSLTVPAAGVLDGDTDVEGSALTAVLVGNASNGSVSLAANGSFTYTPSPNFFGTDTFTYRASDSSLTSNLATVTITVNGVNDAPVADADSYTTAEDVPLTVAAATGVLNGDIDLEGTTLTAVLVSDVQHGTLVLNANGSFTYTPADNYVGPDSFSYKANDGQLDSNVVTVSLDVTAVNDPPVADDDAYSVTEDGSLTEPAATGVLNGDTDVEGAALTAVLVGTVSNGSLTLNPNGSFTYTPNANFFGTDTFTYHASDGSQTSNLATVTLTVAGVNDAPVAQPDSYSVAEDGTLSVAAPGIRENDGDPDGDSLTAIKVTDPTHGSLTLNADGSFTYVPFANYFGPDSFAYMLNDGAVNSNTVTVGLTVTPVNDAPAAVGESYTTAEDTGLVIGTPGLLSNDSDVEGSTLAVVPGTGPANGSLTLNVDGSFSYTPNANYFGPDSFTYTASDGSAGSNPVTVDLTVTPVNDAPTAADDSASVVLNKSVTIKVLLNDADVEGGTLTIQSFTQPTKGTLTRSGSSFIYTATGPLAGADSFSYTIADPQGATATGTVNLTRSDPIGPTLSDVRSRYGAGARGVMSLKGTSRSVLPWADVSRFELTFSENVIPAAGALTLTGPGGTIPLTPGSTPAGGARTATWTLPVLGAGRYTLRLTGAAVQDINANSLPGDYVRSFGILPGDFDGNGVVNNLDLTGIKRNYQTNPARVNRFADINGDGVVNVQDYNLARAALGTRL